MNPIEREMANGYTRQEAKELTFCERHATPIEWGTSLVESVRFAARMRIRQDEILIRMLASNHWVTKASTWIDAGMRLARAYRDTPLVAEVIDRLGAAHALKIYRARWLELGGTL